MAEPLLQVKNLSVVFGRRRSAFTADNSKISVSIDSQIRRKKVPAFPAGKRSGFDAGAALCSFQIILCDPVILICFSGSRNRIGSVKTDLRFRTGQHPDCGSFLRPDPHAVKHQAGVSGDLDPV